HGFGVAEQGIKLSWLKVLCLQVELLKKYA
ncbi:MAG: hypothetical protein OGMRLDGQ_002880, partial [Candidatus Fervidibacter sp.]